MAPRGRETRPTSDRVREALFMTLEPLLGLRVVDLFAGSGALGIEALSRGAIQADFVESNAAARAILSQNLAALGLTSRTKVWAMSLPAGIARLDQALTASDLVLVDPPYGGELARETLAVLGEPGRLKPAARVVVEHHAKDELPEQCGDLARARSRQYGETMVTIYQATAATTRHAGQGEATC